jgi:DNA-binding SARP family transcriptional activator
MGWKPDDGTEIVRGRQHHVAALGPLTIDGQSVTPGQRSLVAALVLHQRSGATAEALTDAIWGKSPPSSARASIQNQIARLRGSFDINLITTRHGRYHLNAITDIARFQHLISPWMSTEPDALAAAELQAALDLWRGLPFEDLTENRAAEIERTRLEHLRGLVIERLAISRLIAGQYAEAIGELSVRTSTEPFHERAWELLVVALFLTGRRTEALTRYATFETILRDGLSAEPSTALKRLRGTVAVDGPLDMDEALRTRQASALVHAFAGS